MNTETKKTQRPDLPSWRFKPSNLGCLKDNPGEIEFKPLTLICGPNNTGKTWVMYALYGFLKSLGRVELPGLDSFLGEIKANGFDTFNSLDWFNDKADELVSAIAMQAEKSLSLALGITKKELGSGRFEWIVGTDELKHSLLHSKIDYRISFGAGGDVKIIKHENDFNFEFLIISNDAKPLGALKFSILMGVGDCIFWGGRRRRVFLLPAERNGLNMMYREMYGLRATVFRDADRLAPEGGYSDGWLKGRNSKNYPEALNDYTDWLYMLPNQGGGGLKESARKVSDLVNGAFSITSDGAVKFSSLPKDGASAFGIDLQAASSTAKSLFGLWAYLEHSAKPGDVLMIDEPELNLHPSNQRKLARFLAQLVNQGLRVVVSTHSDYLVREINSLLMLSRPHPERAGLMEQFGYTEDEILQPDQVAAWLFSDGTISPMEIDAVEGINAKTFDDEIHQLNDTSDSIYYTYQNSADTEGDA